MLEHVNNVDVSSGCEKLEYKGNNFWIQHTYGEVMVITAFFRDGKSKICIDYSSEKEWRITRTTPTIENGAEYEKYWVLNLNENNIEKRLAKRPYYKEACLLVKEAYNKLVEYPRVQGMKAVGRGRIITYNGMKIELSNQKLAKYNNIASTYLMDGEVKIRLSYNGLSYTQSRYRGKDEIKPYWSHSYTSYDIVNTKYASYFEMLKQAHSLYKQ